MSLFRPACLLSLFMALAVSGCWSGRGRDGAATAGDDGSMVVEVASPEVKEELLGRSSPPGQSLPAVLVGQPAPAKPLPAPKDATVTAGRAPTPGVANPPPPREKVVPSMDDLAEAPLPPDLMSDAEEPGRRPIINSATDGKTLRHDLAELRLEDKPRPLPPADAARDGAAVPAKGKAGATTAQTVEVARPVEVVSGVPDPVLLHGKKPPTVAQTTDQSTAPAPAAATQPVVPAVPQLVLFLPIKSSDSMVSSKDLYRRIAKVLNEKKTPFQDPFGGNPRFRVVPSPEQQAGADELHRFGIHFVVTGALEIGPSGMLTLELHQPPKPGVIWAATAPVANQYYLDSAVRHLMGQLLMRLAVMGTIIPYELPESVAPPIEAAQSKPAVGLPPLLDSKAMSALYRQVERPTLRDQRERVQNHKPTPESQSVPPARLVQAQPTVPPTQSMAPKSTQSMAPKSTTTSLGKGEEFFEVQAGAYAGIESATRAAEDLRKKGYAAYVQESTEKPGVKWFLVRIGRFATRGQAEALAAELQAKTGLAAFPARKKGASK